MKKFSEKLKDLFSSEASLQRIPLYFFITCVLMVILIFKLGETNQYLKEIAANNTDVIQIETKDSEYESVADVYIESTKSAEDIVPLLGEINEENATKKSEESTTKQSSKETTTKKTETTTKQAQSTQPNNQNGDNNSSKTTYVLNISSKKIHFADCSFVDRTKEENKKTVELTDAELQEYLSDGYTFCKTCGGD